MISVRRLLTPVNPSRYYLRRWVQEAGALGGSKDFRVLDAGAGSAPYRDFFSGVTYETADWNGGDYVCDLSALPMPDRTYDLVLSTQTLEHVAEPVKVLSEYHRVLKPGGQAWLSAPLFHREHGEPHDYFRFTQFAWRHMAGVAGFKVEEIAWLEGFYGTLSYQFVNAAADLPKRWFPLRGLLLMLSHWFAWRDTRHRIVDRGMCRNYRVVLSKP